MKEKFSSFIIKNRVFFIIFPFILIFLFSFKIKNLKVETNIGEFIPQNHPFIEVEKKLEKIFGGLNQINIVIKVKKGDIFNRDTLKKIYDFTEELYFTDGVNISRVNGIAARKMRNVKIIEGGFSVKRLMPDVPQTKEEIKQLKQVILRNPMIYGVYVSKDLKSTLIQADFFSGIPARKILEEIKEMTDKIKGDNIEVYFSGRPILEGYIDFYISKLWYLFIFTFLILGFLLHSSFHSKRGVILPLLSSSISTYLGLSSLTFFNFNITPSTILVPFLIFSLCVSHSVQFIERYYEEIENSKDRKQISKNILNHLIGPASISIITDGIGFLSLIILPLKLIKSMAISASIGVFSIFFTSILFIPSVLSFLKIPERKYEEVGYIKKFLDKISNIVVMKRKVAFTVFSIVILSGIWGITKIEIGDNQPGSPVLYSFSHYNRSETVINKEFSGTDPYYILVEGKLPESILSSEVMKEMDSLQKYILKNSDRVGRAISVVDYIKGFNMIFNDGKREFYRVPDNDGTIGEYIFLYSMSGYPGDFDPIVSPDFKDANIKFDVKDHKNSTIKHLLDLTKRWIKENHKTKKVDFLFPGGIIGTVAAVNDIIKKNLPANFLLVSSLIFILSSILLRSLLQGTLLLIPLFFSILTTFGIMGFLKVPITIMSLPIVSLGIGLGVDYGIYIMTRLKETGEEIEKTIFTTGKAVFITAFSVSLGLIVLVLSPLKMAAKLGISLSVLLLLNMVSSLILLPSLFIIKYKKNGGER